MILLVDVSSTVHADYMTQGENAAETSLNRIRDFVQRFSPDSVFGAADTSCQWRKDLLPSYKANRKPKDEELKVQIQAFKDGFDWGPIEVGVDSEADDVIATQCYLHSTDQVVIFSRDKDMRQLLVKGRVVLMRTFNSQQLGRRHPVWYSADDLAKPVDQKGWGIEPAQCVDFQAVTGDAADCVPGANGVGPKTISPLLARYKTIENVLAYGHLSVSKKKNLEAIMPNLEAVRKVLTLNSRCQLRTDRAKETVVSMKT